MPPGATTSRILWARSGGRCAVCRSPLLTGAEAAARLDEAGSYTYDNLILLCEEHRTTAGPIGAQREAELARIKAEHEEWLRRSPLAEHPTDPAVRYDPRYQGVTLLPRVRAGAGLARLLDGIHSLQYDQEKGATPGEREAVEGFLGYLRGVTDLWSAYDANERRRVVEHLDDQIHGLDNRGLLLFATRYTAGAGVAGDWAILRLWILREGADTAGSKG